MTEQRKTFIDLSEYRKELEILNADPFTLDEFATKTIGLIKQLLSIVETQGQCIDRLHLVVKKILEQERGVNEKK
ncbi:hypothetical protein O3615_03325 [Streptococcus salivarius]|jgi:hypothetical protein|uniref:hypothetical protein n=1 Tax=Streptococcus salivarius TaxID=1304 RepID=UPI0018AB93E0|nr:hypothetical protein [Streptococcus salivarius]